MKMFFKYFKRNFICAWESYLSTLFVLFFILCCIFGVGIIGDIIYYSFGTLWLVIFLFIVVVLSCISPTIVNTVKDIIRLRKEY